MNRYDTYNPEINIKEELPPADLPSIEEEGGNNSTQKRRRTAISKERRDRTKSPKRNRGSKNDSAKNRTESDNVGFFTKLTQTLTSQTSRWLLGIFIGAFGVYLLVAFISYFTNCIHDQAAISYSNIGYATSIGNKAGEGGARISEFLINNCFGLGSFVIILWLGVISLKLLSGWPRFKTVNFTIKCLVALITVSLIIGLATLSLNSPVNWGGFHGRYVNEFVIHFLGWTGAVILCLALVAAFFVICLRDVVNWIIRKRKEIADRRHRAAEEKALAEERQRKLEEMIIRESEDAAKAGDAHSNGEEGISSLEEEPLKFSGEEMDIDPSLTHYDLDEEDAEADLHPAYRPSEQIYSEEDDISSSGNDDEFSDETNLNSYNNTDSESDANGKEEGFEAKTEPEKLSEFSAERSDETLDKSVENENGEEMVVNVNRISEVKPSNNNDSLIRKHYRFPSPMLLREGSGEITVDVREMEANKERIRETLLYHKIPISSIEATVGPSVTLYEIRPEQGVKIARIKNLADDIALSLSAIGVRIIAPIPGKGTVGIEVANEVPQTVSMRTIICSPKYNETRYKLPVALGCTIGNDVYIADLAKMPHLLVAGATGQGKSVGLNAIIASLLYKKRPDELKFVMIDPKEVEFSLYAKIEQHYLAKLEGSDPIVTDMSKVVETLQSLCVEMDNRYKLLRTAQVRNIEEYNPKFTSGQLDTAEGHRFLPYIVVVVDEFADLIMTSGKEVETPIARLAQKARAIGIHVIIATQRPSTNVITGIIKANFPVRIAFKVSSGVDSKTILDATGAQQLIGRGDMLISNNSAMVRVQCAFIDTPEVEAICDHISKQPFNSGPLILPEPQMGVSEGIEGSGRMGGGNAERDALFEEAARLVVQSGSGSTSYLQRHFGIGYTRAGKIMDQLECFGIVTPSTGGKARDVLVDPAGLEMLLSNIC